jgi:hypothetical protein
MLASSRRSRSECRVSRPRGSCRRQSNIAQAKGSTDAAVVSLSDANFPVGVDAGGAPQSPAPATALCGDHPYPLHVVCHADGHRLHPGAWRDLLVAEHCDQVQGVDLASVVGLGASKARRASVLIATFGRIVHFA